MRKSLRIKEGVSLAPFTTFRVGGDAKYFAEVENEDELGEALDFAVRAALPVFVLGGGSNILVSDDGFDGLVIRIALKGISLMEVPGGTESGAVLVTARAGEDWDDFVAWCVANDLAGLECLSGIPGLVGGTPIQNVGAYGQEVSESIVSVRVFDRYSGSVRDLGNDECGFGYRSSIFNTAERERHIVLSVTYELVRDGSPKVAYSDLIKAIGDGEATLAETRSAVCSIRASKGMLVRQGGADAQSAGSFFKNPVVSAERFEHIRRTARERGMLGEDEDVPRFPAGVDDVKIPAAWLIERCGFPKGYEKGHAGLSTLHTLAITNRNGATAREILALKDEIRARVSEIFAIDLVQEPTLVGF